MLFSQDKRRLRFRECEDFIGEQTNLSDFKVFRHKGAKISGILIVQKALWHRRRQIQRLGADEAVYGAASLRLCSHTSGQSPVVCMLLYRAA